MTAMAYSYSDNIVGAGSTFNPMFYGAAMAAMGVGLQSGLTKPFKLATFINNNIGVTNPSAGRRVYWDLSAL